MTKYYRLDALYGPMPPIELKPVSAFALYVDQGPKGACGQGGDITCPWAQLHLFDNIDQMMEAKIGRDGVKAFVIRGVADEWSSQGT